MAKHEVVIHENLGATKTSAAYLGSYIAKETVKEGSFALSACMKAGMSPIQFRAIIDGSFQAIEDLEREGLVRVNTDLGVICAYISGSFPTADAAPDPEKNKLCLCLRLADEIRLSLADKVPTIVADESLTKLRVDNVMDLETPRPYNLIHGKHVFRVAGVNMVLDDVGATVYLTDKNGVTYEVVVDEVISKQLFKGHTANLLQPGDYKLVVKSRAGDAEGPLQTAFRRVKYLDVADPITVDDIASEGHEGEIVSGTAFAAKGSGLDAFDAEAGDTVKVKWSQGGEDKEATIAPAEVTAAKMSFEFPDELVGVPVDTELTFEITFGETLKTKGATLVDA